MRGLLLAGVLGFTAMCGEAPEENVDSTSDSDGMLFLDVEVLSMSSDSVLSQHEVRIEGDLISAVNVALDPRDEEEVVRCAGCFLFPGLIDFHVHLDHPDEIHLYLPHGVTTVVNLRGHPGHLELAGAVERGELAGPRVLTAGENLTGVPPDFGIMQSLGDTVSLRRAVSYQSAQGYRVIKLYDELPPEHIRYAARVARDLGLPVVAHLPTAITPKELAGLGITNVAHAEELVPVLQEHGVPAVVDAVRRSGASVTVNAAFLRNVVVQGSDPESVLDLPEAETLPPAIHQSFRSENNRFVERDSSFYARNRDNLGSVLEFVRLANASGIPLLAGTDASTAGVYPGLSVWQEIHELAEAGLGRFEALRSATAVPGELLGEHFGLPVPTGRIEEGYAADLVLARTDPRTGRVRPEDIVGVMVGGRWYPRDDLSDALERNRIRRREVELAVRRLEIAIEEKSDRVLEIYREEARATEEETLFHHYIVFGTAVSRGEAAMEEGQAIDPAALAHAADLMRIFSLAHPHEHASRLYEARFALALGDSSAARRHLAAARGLVPDDERYARLMDSLCHGKEKGCTSPEDFESEPVAEIP